MDDNQLPDWHSQSPNYSTYYNTTQVESNGSNAGGRLGCLVLLAAAGLGYCSSGRTVTPQMREAERLEKARDEYLKSHSSSPAAFPSPTDPGNAPSTPAASPPG